jgi:Co/Zn/Cd efflux system component
MPTSRTANDDDDQLSSDSNDNGSSSSKESGSPSLLKQEMEDPQQRIPNGRHHKQSTSSPLMREGAAVHRSHDGHNHDSIPSNERLLGTAFFSFMMFALTQLVFAFVAGSEAMMGDSAAMIVDSMTYLFNWIAERRKNRFDQLNDDSSLPVGADAITAARIRERSKRKLVLQMEIFVPLISVTTLVMVTIFVTKKAVGVLLLDMHRGRDEQRMPNIHLMLAFSIFNLALDGLNVFCFARSKHLMGYATIEEDSDRVTLLDDLSRPVVLLETMHDDSESRDEAALQKQQIRGYKQFPIVNGHGMNSDDRCDNAKDASYANLSPQRPQPAETEATAADEENGYNRSFDDVHDDHHNKEHANLNMCSAYTHVFADTLRSLAVIVASCIAEILPQVTPEEADATAAIVVSFLILLSLMPLIQGLVHSAAELRAILAEERSETVFLRSRTCNFEMT